MAVTFDASTSGGGFPGNTVTISGHSLAAGTDRIVLACIEILGPTAPRFFDVGPNYNGTAMAFLFEASQAYYGRFVTMSIFYLLDASLPGAGTYSMEYSTGGGPYGSTASVLSYQGVNQVAPPFDSGVGFSNPSFTGGTPVTTNITLAASAGILVSAMGYEATGNVITSGSGQTQRESPGSSDYSVVSDKAFSSSGANSMTETPGNSYDAYAHVLIELAEPGGAAGPAQNPAIIGAHF